MVNVGDRFKKIKGYYGHKELARNGVFTWGFVVYKNGGNYLVGEYSSEGDTLYHDRNVDCFMTIPGHIPLPNDFFEQLREMDEMRGVNGKKDIKKRPFIVR